MAAKAESRAAAFARQVAVVQQMQKDAEEAWALVFAATCEAAASVLHEDARRAEERALAALKALPSCR